MGWGEVGWGVTLLFGGAKASAPDALPPSNKQILPSNKQILRAVAGPWVCRLGLCLGLGLGLGLCLCPCLGLCQCLGLGLGIALSIAPVSK